MVYRERSSCCFGLGSDPGSGNQPSPNQFSQGEGSRIAEWAKSFDKLLEDPDGVQCFHNFLKKEYADENIKFWIACRNYENTVDPKKREEEAAKIIAEYLVSGAPNPINVGATGRDDVIKNCQAAPPGLFKPMQKQIYNLMMYGKYWEFTRSEDYLSLLEQEKLGKQPFFEHISSPKDGKRKNVISNDVHGNSRSNNNRRFFSNFFGILKRERLSEENLEGLPSSKHCHNNITPMKQPPSKHHILLEMPNCTYHRAFYSSTDTVKTCIERALINSGVNWSCYHVCLKKTGEVIDITKPVTQFANMTLSFLNTPTFQISVCNNKKFKFCTTHGKTLKEVCKTALNEHNIDLRSIILFEHDSRSYVRLDTPSILVANKNLEVRDITRRTTSVPRIDRRVSKSTMRRSMAGPGGCSGSLESNIDLLSSVMESSDDENTEISPGSGGGNQLVRSQSELEFFELLNRVQCDRLDNQRCSDPTVLKNLSLGRQNDSVKDLKSTHSFKRSSMPRGGEVAEQKSRPPGNRAHSMSCKLSPTAAAVPRHQSDDEDEIDYC